MNLGNGFLLLWGMVIAGSCGLALLVVAYLWVRRRDG